MNTIGTTSILEIKRLSALSGTGNLCTRSWLSGLLGAGLVACAGSSNVLPAGHTSAPWSAVTSTGTPRVQHLRTNHYVPKTTLGRRLLALRQTAVASGLELVPMQQIIAKQLSFRS